MAGLLVISLSSKLKQLTRCPVWCVSIGSVLLKVSYRQLITMQIKKIFKNQLDVALRIHGLLEKLVNLFYFFVRLHFWHNCVLEVLQALSHETSAQFGEELTYWGTVQCRKVCLKCTCTVLKWRWFHILFNNKKYFVARSTPFSNWFFWKNEKHARNKTTIQPIIRLRWDKCLDSFQFLQCFQT
jgi:hypothetical protein